MDEMINIKYSKHQFPYSPNTQSSIMTCYSVQTFFSSSSSLMAEAVEKSKNENKIESHNMEQMLFVQFICLKLVKCLLKMS